MDYIFYLRPVSGSKDLPDVLLDCDSCEKCFDDVLNDLPDLIRDYVSGHNLADYAFVLQLHRK